MSRANSQEKLVGRVAQLSTAAELAAGRSAKDVVTKAAQVAENADRRLAFSGDDTVIALAGATGSGKSTLFNAISGTKLAEPGIRRPTTSAALGAYWGTQLPSELLDWLEIPRRQLIRGDEAAMDGLLLIDLPDHDSTEVAHRMEVDRMVQLVDQLIWVVDPQKYADAALHDGYLKPLAEYSDVMLVVMNQADKLPADELKQAMSDLRRILDDEGLRDTPLMAVSAVTGHGIPELRKQIKRILTSKRAAAQRLSADVDVAAKALLRDLGDVAKAEVSQDQARQLTDVLAEAAGVPVVRDAVLGSMRRRGRIATSFPLTKWISSLKVDPLRALHLDRSRLVRSLGSSKRKPGENELEPTTTQRTNLQPAQLRSGAGVKASQVDSALRALARQAGDELPAGWSDAVRAATLTNREQLPDRLDEAIAKTDLRLDEGHGWWTFINVLQWLIFVVAVVGGGWLLVDVILDSLQIPKLPSFMIGSWPLPTLLLIGGVLAGLLVGGLSRFGVDAGARSKALRAERTLTQAIGAVADQLVIDPVNQELARHDQARVAAARALS